MVLNLLKSLYKPGGPFETNHFQNFQTIQSCIHCTNLEVCISKLSKLYKTVHTVQSSGPFGTKVPDMAVLFCKTIGFVLKLAVFSHLVTFSFVLRKKKWF